MASQAILLLLLAHFIRQVPEINAKIPAIIVFGDSTVDSGNNNEISTVLKSNFEPYGRDFPGRKPTGRFSNGRLATDFLSEALGIKPAIPPYLDPAYDISEFATGVCFASAGTGYDNATSDVLSVIPLWKELEYYKEYQGKLRKYLGNEKANQLLSKALHLISIGTNDFLENYYVSSNRSSEYSVGEYQNFLIGIATDFINHLYQLGARKISIIGLAPMGCVPLERTTNILFGRKCIEAYNNVAKDFNKKLQGSIMKLQKELDGIQLVLADAYDFVLEMIDNPNSFGFDDVETACCGTGYIEMSYMCNRGSLFTCSDANKYMFWDSFHPTEKTNSIVADYLFKNYLAQFKNDSPQFKNDSAPFKNDSFSLTMSYMPFCIFVVYTTINRFLA
ncbi:hypothetical protein SLEP1_g28201 [Rubroshorea leprosula]|uniref:GDSL esterase/lipase n=1 Tax=Rubroshorea leprosula TaxID=152421 RepID=A0AAV5JSW4_9ROSI|nr:hypothetical protein SLEP1_g28201 [Rubroshorea leprosula]